MLLNPQATFELATRFRSGQANLGEVFAFISGLYFRGKLAYVRRFASPPAGVAPSLVIVPGRGLVDPDIAFTPDDLQEIARVPVDLRESAYVNPLLSWASDLQRLLPAGCPVVLLGSVATPKYTEPLLGIFGSNLHFPREFAGLGDMSRGALMLRRAEAGQELVCGCVTELPVPVRGTKRRLSPEISGDLERM